MMNLERKAILSPLSINLRVKDNKISIQYKITDEFSGIGMGDTWLVFTPTNELMESFLKEINTAIKNKK